MKIADLLVGAGVHPDEGPFVLQQALLHRQHTVLRRLIHHGVDLETRLPSLETPLHFSLRFNDPWKRNKEELLELLLNAGASMESLSKKGEPPLMAWLSSANHQPKDTGTWLIGHGADVNWVCKEG